MKTTPLAIILAVVALLGGLTARELITASLAAEASNNLPEFSLPDIDGKLHTNKEWQGKILIINYWATWCPPCLKEMPEFAAFQKEFASQDVQVIGIALDDADAVKEFIKTQQIDYPILLGEDKGSQLAHSMGNTVNTVPFTAIFNQQGQIIHQKMGVMNREDLLKVIKPLTATTKL